MLRALFFAVATTRAFLAFSGVGGATEPAGYSVKNLGLLLTARNNVTYILSSIQTYIIT